MGKAIRRLRSESQKSIINQIERLNGKYSMWDIWQDFIVMFAISIANVFEGPYKADREKEYLSRAKKYSEAEMAVFSNMLSEVVLEMERNPDQDFLGDLFMALNLSNEWKGQFFTPYSVCRMMAKTTCGSSLKQRVEERGWVSVNDPACGAGALLIAFANECRHPGNDVNYQTSVLFVAQDIDFLAGCMCYIQLSLLGCPGYVVIDDSITRPATCVDRRGLMPVEGPNVWYTPMYHRDVWHWRRLFAQIDIICPENSTQVSQQSALSAPQTKMKEFICDAEQMTSEAVATAVNKVKILNETKTGQLTLF